MDDMKRHYKRVLTIAGSDPSGGAGIQADLKTFAACGCYGASAIVAVVDENTLGVKGIHEIPVDFVTGQICSVLDDIGADAIKIGMLHSSELILAVKQTLMRYNIRDVVLDPVMVATSGDRLLRDDAIETLRSELIPYASIFTPNIPEAEALLGCKISSRKDMIDVIRDLSADRQVSVYLKAGHLKEQNSADVFYNAETDEIIELNFYLCNTKNTHGTGCTLSSAIAAFLARGLAPNDAVRRAKDYVNRAIIEGAHYAIGKGNGPVHHFHRYWI
jgi:hydroxymethylpyrimidine/phosphomethylpyrimidine kinase